MNKAILKSKSPVGMASLIIGFVLGTLLFICGIVSTIKASDSVEKFTRTEDYKKAIVAELDEIENDYETGKISENFRDVRIENTTGIFHARKILKASENYSELKEEISQNDTIAGALVSVGTLCMIGATAGAAYIGKKEDESSAENENV